MTLKIILKGGPGSGHKGHTGSPGRGGSLPRGGSVAGTGGVPTVAATISLRGRSKGQSRALLSMTGKAPRSITNSQNALLLIPKGSGAVYGIAAGPQETMHALVAAEIGITGKVFDEYIRPAIEDGVVTFSTHTSGSVNPSDKVAERNIKFAASRMIDMGFSPTLPVVWELRTGGKVKGVSLRDMT